VGTGSRLYGVIVDGVEEVANFSVTDIQPTPDFGGAIDTRFLTGMAKSGDSVKALIDLDAIAAAEGVSLEVPAALSSAIAQ
jgi:purine-binding chemotaxis protein CheW